MNRSLTGKTTGLVVDSGECLTSCFPISGGTINKHAVKTIPFGGRDVTEYINRQMAEEWGLSLSSYGQVRRPSCRPCAEDCSILSDSILLQQLFFKPATATERGAATDERGPLLLRRAAGEAGRAGVQAPRRPGHHAHGPWVAATRRPALADFESRLACL